MTIVSADTAAIELVAAFACFASLAVKASHLFEQQRAFESGRPADTGSVRDRGAGVAKGEESLEARILARAQAELASATTAPSSPSCVTSLQIRRPARNAPQYICLCV
jgi:hypothetical protein